MSAWGAWRAYREVTADELLPPSGADLVAQWTGGVAGLDLKQQVVKPLFGHGLWDDLLVFSAVGQPGRKVPTHEHLAKLKHSNVLSGSLISELSARVLRAHDILDRPAEFGRALSDYADTLAQAGLELEASRADREALCARPGVLGAKGTGALLADALAVLIEPGTPHRANVIAAAQARGLRLMANGLGERAQPGLLLEEPLHE
jgi:hypothetical protein